MSGEAESQPVKAAPKAPAVVSTFINKGAKTFAPKKAVRRRPAAAITAVPKPPAPPIPTPASTLLVDENSPNLSQSRSSPVPAVEQGAPQPKPTSTAKQSSAPKIPTPSLTKDVPTEGTTQTEQAVLEPSVAIAVPSTSDSATKQLSTSASTNNDPLIPQNSRTIAPSALSTPQISTLPTAEDRSVQSSRRQSLQTSDQSGTFQSGREVHAAHPSPLAQDEHSSDVLAKDARPEPDQSAVAVTKQTGQDAIEPFTNADHPTEVTVDATEIPSHDSRAPLETSAEIARPANQNTTNTEEVSTASVVTRPGRAYQNWVTVNNGDNDGEAAASTPKPRKPPGRRRRKAITLQNLDDEAEEAAREAAEAVERGDEVPSQTRPSAKARGKRKAVEPPAGENNTAQPPAKKRRQPRRTGTKNPAPVEAGLSGEPEAGTDVGPIIETQSTGGNGGNGGNNRAPARPNATRKRKRPTTSQPDNDGEAEGEAEQGEQPPKRRTRPPRAPTPSDAEDEVIDEDKFFMDDLTKSSHRLGKLSQRERKMRTIDWDAVKQRQREKEAEQMNSREVQERIRREQQEKEDAQREIQERVTYEIVDGQARITQNSGRVDYQALAEAAYTEEIVEEDDFTNRINARSFMRNGKRRPEEFMMPGQGKRWNIRDTEDFYDALRMCGSDFEMMSTLFKGVTRRSLKLKFTREEKKNPDIIKEILQRPHTQLKDWDAYLRVSGKVNEQFDKVEQIKRELAEEEEKGKVEIEKAKAKYEEDMRQKRLAGVLSDDEEDQDGEAGKKKKGKKDKEKHVTFDQGEDDVEILEVDENDGWGEE